MGILSGASRLLVDVRQTVPTPILRPFDQVGDTDHVDFDTSKPVRQTDPDMCPVNYTVADSRWEHRVEMDLEALDSIVLRYVKNQGLGFTNPYNVDGRSRSYYPDFLVDLDDGHGGEDPLHVVLEVSGQRNRDKKAKVDTARTLWVPAVNNAGRFGRWRFVEIADPFETADVLRAISSPTPMGAS